MYELDNDINYKEKIARILGKIAHFLISFVETAIISLTVSIVLYLFVATGEQVIGSSMYPTYKDGESLMADKISYKLTEPQRGDVIIFKYSDTRDFIKRIIGLPGEKVTLKDGYIYINNEKLDESTYLENTVYTNGEEYLHEGETITLENDEYFVCGDNRQHSYDSRGFGPIKKTDIKGKAWFIYYPAKDFELITKPVYKNI